MLFRVSAGISFLTVVMSLGVQYRLVYVYALGIILGVCRTKAIFD